METNVNTKSVKESGEEQIGIIFSKSGIYDLFEPALACDHLQMYTYCILAILHKFTLHLNFLQNRLSFLRSELTTEEWF